MLPHLHCHKQWCYQNGLGANKSKLFFLSKIGRIISGIWAGDRIVFLFHHAHWDRTEEWLCPSLGSRTTLAQGPSAHVPLLFGTTFHYLCVQPPQLPPSKAVSKHTFLTWPSPRRHRCGQLPIAFTERLQRLRIWTPIWLLRHWALLHRWYWCYWNSIDWLDGARPQPGGPKKPPRKKGTHSQGGKCSLCGFAKHYGGTCNRQHGRWVLYWQCRRHLRGN